ncbi:hypothetical protein CEP54_003563 [Fusarium duplospermum]|uniref:Uncharacterized protein n=1 Tax=Fusarium duplospermum TaxID=1325734 RepID=A0A428QNE4_9HYPO|nr:hypothetical protein CEP54_003563 [Fusarium duplospermum]
MKFANFPILIPAFTAQIYIDAPLVINPDLLNIPFVPNLGTLVSEPGYEPPLEATFVHGSDFLRRDPDGERVRLDVSSVARDSASGAMLRFSYNGVVGMAGDEGRVIRGDGNATTTGFGNACEFCPSHEPCAWRCPLSISSLRRVSVGILVNPPWLISIVVQVRFETNASGLKPLQDKLYVGSGRFIVEENQPIIVEYKISEVGAQCSEQPKDG